MVEQRGQGGLLVAKQADDLLAWLRRCAVTRQPSARIERLLARLQIPFANQPAGARREAGIEKPFAQASARAAHLRRTQLVRTFDELLGAEVLEVEPQRRPDRARDAAREGTGQIATEGFDHDIAWFDVDHAMWPRAQFDASCAIRCHPTQRRGIVDPQPYLVTARTEIGGKPPAHADVAEVVDDAAEQVPVQWLHRPHYPKARGTIALDDRRRRF